MGIYGKLKIPADSPLTALELMEGSRGVLSSIVSVPEEQQAGSKAPV